MKRFVPFAALVALLHCIALPICAQSVLASPREAILERGNGPEPSTLDAHRCQEIACGNVLRDLYEGLVAEGPDGAPIPGTAERWEVSGDGLTWTFHLRAGLRWSNGEPLTAAQIAASFRRAFAPSTAAPFAEQFGALRNAQAVETGRLPLAALGVSTPDPRSVVLNLTRPAPLLRLLLLPIAYPVYLPAVIRNGAQHTRPGNLVTNGAYALHAWLPQAAITLQRNPNFRTPAPIAQVRYLVTEDAGSELKRYEAGDLDLTETLPPQPLVQLRARFGSELRIAPYLGAFWFGFNVTKPPFSDADDKHSAARLRKALSLAVDRDKLTLYLTGFGEKPAFGVVPPQVSGYVPWTVTASKWTQAQRDQEAQRLFREAGYSSANPPTVELRFNTSVLHSPARTRGRGDVARNTRRACHLAQ